MNSHTLIFATHNEHKLTELKAILPELTILGLKDLDIHEDIPENGDTIEANAIIKANFLYDLKGDPCLAEDTGLEVEALGGAPGVNTARYAGDDRDPSKNNAFLLSNLQGTVNRKARFKTVIALCSHDGTRTFEGIVNGKIATQLAGDGGFGYDPIFIPDGYEETFASLSSEIKNKISHRARAVQAMKDFLQIL